MKREGGQKGLGRDRSCGESDDVQFGIAEASTAAGLRGLLSDVTFVARLVSEPGGSARFEVFLPPLTRSFPLEAGRGYVLVTSTAQTLVWPTGP